MTDHRPTRAQVQAQIDDAVRRLNAGEAPGRITTRLLDLAESLDGCVVVHRDDCPNPYSAVIAEEIAVGLPVPAMTTGKRMGYDVALVAVFGVSDD